MKYFFTLLLLFVVVFVKAQWSEEYFINFETYYATTVPYQNFISIDTISYNHNEWQVGHPGKTTFNAARSNPSAIVTDTLSACIPNDTSVFILKLRNIGLLLGFGFAYRLDIDSGDIAMIEVSTDTGEHWMNILTDTTIDFYFDNGKPDLSTSTNGWDSTSLYFENPGPYSQGDSFLFRFTYITDSSLAPRDGWMIDNFWIGFAWEGVKNINQNLSFDLYPNPADKQLIIKHKLQEAVTVDVALMNSIGQVVYTTERKKMSAADEIAVDVGEMPDGMYFCSVTIEGQKITKQVTVLH